MNTIRDYNLMEPVPKPSRSSFFRARKADGPEEVLIERMDVSGLDASEISRALQELESLKALKSPHVDRILDVFQDGRFILVVYESIADQPLFSAFPPGKTKLDAFLTLAQTLARTLEDLHGQGIVHHLLNPETIRRDLDGNLRITGVVPSPLGAGFLDVIGDPLTAKALLPYISPEQTGRISRPVDHRADFYSLGIVFHELLTGAPPFASADPTELIHSHIAMIPIPPVEKNPAIPSMVSEIVMKLMAKPVESRYQSAAGLLADLAECARRLRENGSITPFELGRWDISTKLSFPEKLFGRETEIAALHQALGRILAGGSEFCVITGPAGIGKSALIHQMKPSFTDDGAWCILGKAEQGKGEMPYFPLTQAFAELARQVLCESDDSIHGWKTAFSRAVGSRGRLLTDLVPDFGHIIGPQPAFPDTGPGLAHHRIHHLLTEFMNVCADQAHPLVMVLEDFQWADPASFNFLRTLAAGPPIPHLMVMMAYRNDADNAHPLFPLLTEARNSGAGVSAISPSPLSVFQIQEMVHELCGPGPPPEEIPGILHQKTGGNPFFLRQFLNTLHETRLLARDPDGGWHWDLEKIAVVRMTDNVVDFMAAKLEALPPATLTTLKTAACLGNQFSLAAHAPENFGHMVWFVEAEMARRKGRRIADALYKNAIAEARENGFTQHAAMACESLAGFYLDQGMDDFAASFMNQAVALYEQWGARAKVRKLQKTHGWLLGLSPRSPERAISSEHRPAGAKDRLDIAAVMKISQAISSEIQLDRLLVTLMRVVMENSGAEKALLILNREDRLVVDARTEANPETIRVLQSIPLEDCPDLCPGIIHFARRTGAPLVIADALTDDRFSQDPYIRKNRIRSVLCLPLIRRQRTIGLIYLENNLTPNAFTQERIETISLLSSHTANCLENAVFFEASRAAEKQAQQQREQYQKLVETMNDGLAIIDPRLHVSYVNPALCRMTKYRAEEIVGRPAIDFLDEENQRKLEYEVTHWVDLDRHIFEIDWTVKNGAKLSTIVSPKPLYDAQGEFAGFLGIVTDVTQLKQAEKEKELAQAQLLQAQKLEAIGTLAGGVAHDFNNYLTTILGSVDLITMKNDLPENIRKHIQNIRRAAELSASLTRQLLAFGRVQMLQMTAIDLNTVINDISPMLGRLIGENITLTTRLAPDLKTITADFGQMEQIIMNLAVNARDAMPGGGTLLLATANAVIDADRARKMKHAVPGEYVCLSVEDTGEGMDAETVDRIFDPFFSSKAPGHGTGLGLSVVYGVVKQHHGWIDVDSAPGRGARFHIYLPVSGGAASAATTHRKEAMRDAHEGKAQRILLIEDQPEVRNVVRLALTENGYRVFEAATLADAEAVMAAAGQGFDLVFSDVILPDGNGIDFAAQVIHRHPDIRVLMSSGYTEETSRPDTIAEKEFYFLQKPYPLGQMLDTVRRILSAPPQPEA